MTLLIAFEPLAGNAATKTSCTVGVPAWPVPEPEEPAVSPAPPPRQAVNIMASIAIHIQFATFRHCIIILTTNLGATSHRTSGLGFARGVDAFSSDAIPAHLLTREAIALYLSKLSPRGIVVLHLSNSTLRAARNSSFLLVCSGL